MSDESKIYGDFSCAHAPTFDGDGSHIAAASEGEENLV